MLSSQAHQSYDAHAHCPYLKSPQHAYRRMDHYPCRSPPVLHFDMDMNNFDVVSFELVYKDKNKEMSASDWP
jgi:hypothetical protein